MTDMNSSVKAIEWFEPMAPVESSKSEMLSLPDGTGWAPVIMGRVFVVPSPPPFYLGSGYATLALAATFNSVALFVIQLSKLFQHEHVCQNRRTFVKQNFLSS